MDDQYQCDFNLKNPQKNGKCKLFEGFKIFFRISTTVSYNLNKARGVTFMSKATLKQLKGTAFKFLRCRKAVTKCV